MSKAKAVLTIKVEGATYEIFTMNPRDHFPLFGGSSRGLYAGKTASLVTRHTGGNAMRDTERDIFDPNFWQFIAKCINREFEAKAELPAPADKGE